MEKFRKIEKEASEISVIEASGTFETRKGMKDEKHVNVEYGKWFGSLITDAIGDQNEQPKAVLFVTLTFEKTGSGRQRRLAEGQPHGQREMNAFKDVYNRVCRGIVGRNFHRESHRHLLPKVLAFIDAEGSKFWSTAGELTNLHIHSIWVIPASQSDQFNEKLKGIVERQANDVRFDAVDVKVLPAGDTQSINRVASYSSKLIGFNQFELGIAEDFLVLPG